MGSKDVIEKEGEIIETLPNAMFRVRLDNGKVILAHLAGKMRLNYIRLAPGDKVKLEISLYDLERGRIVSRLNK